MKPLQEPCLSVTDGWMDGWIVAGGRACLLQKKLNWGVGGGNG